jgi:hypothetical protein
MKRCGKIEALGLLNIDNVSSMSRDLQHMGGTGRRHAEKKWSKTPGRGRVPKWTLCSQVLLFLGKSGTLLQQYGIGMRKVSGFALFAIKKSQGLLFFEKWHGGRKKTKGRTHP